MTGFASIEFAPLIPGWAIAGLGLAMAALLLFGLARRARGILPRTLTAAVLLAALANPSLVEEQREALSDVAVVVVDRSASQRIGARQAQTDAALAAIEARLAPEPNLDLRVIEVGGGGQDGADGSPGTTPSDGTRLFEALDQALTDVPMSRFAGAIFLTDGQVHDAPAEAERAGLDGPLHTLLTGDRDEFDRRLVIDQAPAYGIVGEVIEITVRFADSGRAPPGYASPRLSVMQDGAAAFDRVLTRDQPLTLEIKVDHGGPILVELAVDPVPGELSDQNNRAVVVVNGVRDRLRVLLVSGEPYAGERVWRNLLKADPSVDLVHFTILRPPEKQDGTPIRELSLIAFPIRELFEIKLDQFDLIIFDRYRRRGVLPYGYLANIADYVTRGGALLAAAGPAFASPVSLYRTPLAKILPSEPTGTIYTQGFRPALTETGRRHPVTAGLPGGGEPPTWGRWFRMIDADPMRGNVLMSGVNGKPVLILDRVGDGRVAQLMSDHAWLWARGFEGGGPQAEMLRRVAHWLMKEPDLEEEDLRAVARGNRLEIERRSLTENGGTVAVTMPSGRRETVALKDGPGGTARASLVVSEPGLYRLSDGTLDAVAAVGAINPKEFTDLRAKPETMAAIAEATGGGLFWLGDRARIPDFRRVKPNRVATGRNWIGLRANRDYVVTGIRQVALLPAFLVLLLALGGLLAAWHREGR